MTKSNKGIDRTFERTVSFAFHPMRFELVSVLLVDRSGVNWPSSSLEFNHSVDHWVWQRVYSHRLGELDVISVQLSLSPGWAVLRATRGDRVVERAWSIDDHAEQGPDAFNPCESSWKAYLASSIPHCEGLLREEGGDHDQG